MAPKESGSDLQVRIYLLDTMMEGEGETVEGLVLLDTNLVIFGQYTISIFDLRGQLVENRRLQLDGQIFSIRYMH